MLTIRFRLSGHFKWPKCLYISYMKYKTAKLKIRPACGMWVNFVYHGNPSYCSDAILMWKSSAQGSQLWPGACPLQIGHLDFNKPLWWATDPIMPAAHLCASDCLCVFRCAAKYEGFGDICAAEAPVGEPGNFLSSLDINSHLCSGFYKYLPNWPRATYFLATHKMQPLSSRRCRRASDTQIFPSQVTKW